HVFFVCLVCLFFFFSSRRRHTRSKRDWSSDVCSSDLFVTGHCERSIDRLDWQALAQDKQTLAFYMSVGQLARIEERLIAHGRAASTPIALVENGSRPEQRVLVGTLSNLTALAAAQQVQPPAILYVGEVAALAAEGCWFNGPALTLPEQEAQRA